MAHPNLQLKIKAKMKNKDMSSDVYRQKTSMNLAQTPYKRFL